MHELCCVGHITLDKIVTPKKTVHMPGGTSFYFAHAIKHFDDIDFALVTAVGASEMGVVDELKQEGIQVTTMPSRYSVYFENIYGENQNNRTQRVLAKADPFTVEALQAVDAKIFHLGSLLADDFSLDVVKYLYSNGLVSADSQGYLRAVRDTNVFAVEWPENKAVFRHVHLLKANEHEMEVLTGSADAKTAGQILYDWGVKEVLLTFGDMGSVVYDGTTFHKIPAYQAREIVDATGCGDTYMTGYLYQRSKGASIEEAGCFAAAMSTLKIEHSGPFSGTKADVRQIIETATKRYPTL